MYHSFEIDLDDGRYLTAGATITARDGEVEEVRLEEIAEGGTEEYKLPEEYGAETVAEVRASIERSVENDSHLAYAAEEHAIAAARETAADLAYDLRREGY